MREKPDLTKLAERLRREHVHADDCASVLLYDTPCDCWLAAVRPAATPTEKPE